MSEYSRVAPQDLRGFVAEVFTAAGMPVEDAAVEAEVLVWANLRGVDSHGVQRVAQYLRMVDAGQIKPRPDIRIERERPGTLVIEADHAFGPVVTVFAMRHAMAKAAETGIGWALIRNTTHQGAIGYYTEMAARGGCAGLAAVCSPPNTAPPGSRIAGVHNSPLSIGVPGGAHGPLVFDMATSVAARGKLDVAIDKGLPIPLGWALDADGRPTTDPKAAKVLLPAGGHKGAGMALMFECLTSLMAANPLLSPRLLGGEQAAPGTQNAFVAALDIAAFCPLAEYRANVDRLVDAIHGLPTSDDADEVLAPGDPETRVRAEREANGIPLPAGTVAKLRDAATRFSLELPSGL